MQPINNWKISNLAPYTVFLTETFKGDLNITSYHKHYTKRWSFALRISSVMWPNECDKCDRSFMWIWSHFLKKSLMENFVFYAVKPVQDKANLVKEKKKILKLALLTRIASIQFTAGKNRIRNLWVLMNSIYVRSCWCWGYQTIVKAILKSFTKYVYRVVY